MSKYKLYEGIDHVMVRLTAAEPLFQLFSEVFDLPVAWPLQQAGFATYGWVNVGNTDLEFWAASSNTDLPADAQPPLFHGFALQPAAPIAQCVGALAGAGLECKAPRAYQTKDQHGDTLTNFTNSVVLSVSTPACCVFFCEWGAGAPIYPWAGGATPVQRRAEAQRELAAKGGGPLGLVGLSAIRLGMGDDAPSKLAWRALTGSTGEVLTLAPGVALQCEQAPRTKILALELAVRSLPAAQQFLAEQGLLGKVWPDEIQLAPQSCGGLDFRLVQARGS